MHGYERQRVELECRHPSILGVLDSVFDHTEEARQSAPSAPHIWAQNENQINRRLGSAYLAARHLRTWRSPQISSTLGWKR
jgi:hypothetical protein